MDDLKESSSFFSKKERLKIFSGICILDSRIVGINEHSSILLNISTYSFSSLFEIKLSVVFMEKLIQKVSNEGEVFKLSSLTLNS